MARRTRHIHHWRLESEERARARQPHVGDEDFVIVGRCRCGARKDMRPYSKRAMRHREPRVANIPVLL